MKTQPRTQRTPEEQAAWDKAAENARGKIGKEWFDAFLPAWQAMGPRWERTVARLRRNTEVDHTPEQVKK